MIRFNRSFLLALVYLLAYLLASGFDHWTTALALERSGATEANVFATSAGAYAPVQAVGLTVIGAIVLLSCIVFASVHADRVAIEWLRHPVRSFKKFYVFPWSSAVINRSPIHLLSFAFALPPVRLIAGANNFLIAEYGVGPVGSVIKAVSAYTSTLVSVLVVVGAIFIFLALALSPVAARAIIWLRGAKLESHEIGL